MAEETEKTSIKQLIQGMTSNEIEILQGIVKSESPFKIQIINDEKLVIGQNITYIPRHLTDYTMTCSLIKEEKGNNETVNDDNKFDCTFNGVLIVHNALKMGEKVHILSFNHGKQYYVLDRVD